MLDGFCTLIFLKYSNVIISLSFLMIKRSLKSQCPQRLNLKRLCLVHSVDRITKPTWTSWKRDLLTLIFLISYISSLVIGKFSRLCGTYTNTYSSQFPEFLGSKCMDGFNCSIQNCRSASDFGSLEDIFSWHEGTLSLMTLISKMVMGG